MHRVTTSWFQEKPSPERKKGGTMSEAAPASSARSQTQQPSQYNLTVSVEDLLAAGSHFGHKAQRWSPKIAPYLYGEKDGIHIFDLFKTHEMLRKAAQRAYDLGRSGKSLVFVGTKRQAQAVILEETSAINASFVITRWLGGTITNWEQIKISINKMNKLTQDLSAGALDEKYTKRERILMEKEKNRLERFLGGIATLKTAPDALFIVDISHEKGAVKEAKAKGIEVIALVDTNADPTLVKYPIPANDDAIRSIKLIVHEIAVAYKEGRDTWQRTQDK